MRALLNSVLVQHVAFQTTSSLDERIRKTDFKRLCTPSVSEQDTSFGTKSRSKSENMPRCLHPKRNSKIHKTGGKNKTLEAMYRTNALEAMSDQLLPVLNAMTSSNDLVAENTNMRTETMPNKMAQKWTCFHRRVESSVKTVNVGTSHAAPALKHALLTASLKQLEVVKRINVFRNIDLWKLYQK